jgi:hypothetical protein
MILKKPPYIIYICDDCGGESDRESGMPCFTRKLVEVVGLCCEYQLEQETHIKFILLKVNRGLSHGT